MLKITDASSQAFMNADKQAIPVLVVDDSPVARKLVEHALPADEYAILAAKTGQEAIELFAKHRPGLVITDWLMPDLSGIELCQRIRSDFQDNFTYIIILTGVSEKSEVVKGLQAGADEYLTKPFHADELLARARVGRRIIALHREIEAKNRLLEQLALTDELTQLPNRRAIEQWATRQLSGAVRHDFPFWVVMADIDQFKLVNDSSGHEAGDIVLKKFAEILRANTRQSDICGRLGGDEFVMIISHAVREGIEVMVQRVREQFEAQCFPFSNGRVVTASFGIAGFDHGRVQHIERLMVQADAALYAAKRLGRNRVELAPVVAALK
jgi:two-component system cell cycle response regulator